MMMACISLSDLTEISQASFAELEALGKELDPRAEESSRVFGKSIAAVEAILKVAYKMAVIAAKRAETLEQEAQAWQIMGEIADSVIRILESLKDKFPRCGTRELYDLALDYKLAADKRFALTNEAIECQTIPMPEGLFPRMT